MSALFGRKDAFSVLQRRGVLELFKDFHKVIDVHIAHLLGNLRDRQIGGGKQIFRLGNPEKKQIFFEGNAGHFFKGQGQSMTADEVFICDFLKGELTVKMLAHIPLCLEDGFSHGAVAVHGKAPRIGAVKLNQDGHKERNAAGDEKVLLQSVFLRHFMKQGQDSGIDLLIQLNHMGKICRSLDENGNQLCFLDVGHEQIAGNGYHITAVGLFENMEGVAFKTADENQRTLFQRVGLVINYGRGLSGCDENHLVFKMCSRHGQAVGHLIRVKTADVGNMGVKHKALGSPFCFIDSL